MNSFNWIKNVFYLLIIYLLNSNAEFPFNKPVKSLSFTFHSDNNTILCFLSDCQKIKIDYVECRGTDFKLDYECYSPDIDSNIYEPQFEILKENYFKIGYKYFLGILLKRKNRPLKYENLNNEIKILNDIQELNFTQSTSSIIYFRRKSFKRFKTVNCKGSNFVLDYYCNGIEAFPKSDDKDGKDSKDDNDKSIAIFSIKCKDGIFNTKHSGNCILGVFLIEN